MEGKAMKLYSDDPRVGHKKDDGSIASWPATDLKGRPYNRAEATLQGVGRFQFVVLPSGGFTEAIEIVTPEPVRAPKMPPKAKEVTEDDTTD
jgi:hypothetical protein